MTKNLASGGMGVYSQNLFRMIFVPKRSENFDSQNILKKDYIKYICNLRYYNAIKNLQLKNGVAYKLVTVVLRIAQN